MSHRTKSADKPLKAVCKLKIASGRKKGRRLTVPKNIEPAKNIVKLAIFSMLKDKVAGAKVLDLFAGSGNLGFEALSLGAENCVFVDNNQNSIDCIKQNAKELKLSDKTITAKSGALDFLSSPLATKYDIVFADPPYKLSIDNIAKKLLNCISAGGVVVYLHHKNTVVAMEGFNVFKQRFYGKTGVSVLKKE